MSNLSLITVPFRGVDLVLVGIEDQPGVVMKPLVEGMGLDWHAQRQKLNTDARRWGAVLVTLPSTSGPQETLCMPLRKLAGWLMTLHPSRTKKSAEIIRMYQEECDDVLWSYWTKGSAVNPRAQSPLLDPSTYPADWSQDAPHKLEQARACAKGTYEMVKKILPVIERIAVECAMIPDPAPIPDERIVHEVRCLKERMANLMAQFRSFDSALRPAIQAPHLMFRPLNHAMDICTALEGVLGRREDAAAEVILVRSVAETLRGLLPNSGMSHEATLAGRALRNIPRNT